MRSGRGGGCADEVGGGEEMGEAGMVGGAGGRKEGHDGVTE